ncbi:polyprenyl synthetase family protein, partial [candidate division KSB1 bacterium]|nr:polyprenyl synthetase family protein [candidate division KSB1 bacterium]
INSHIKEIINQSQPRNLYPPIQYMLAGGGKRLRPILTLISCRAVGGQVEEALDAACAIELLHNFTLVHDDIMDDDDMRRGRPTVHKKWDQGIAILAGDGLIGLAFQSLLRTRSPQISQILNLFTEGVIEVCEGQALDKEFEDRPRVSLDEYFNMIRKKTGKMIALSAQVGGLIGGGGPEQVAGLEMYGSLIGKAFQIQDDLLDITSSEEVIGKTFGSDITAGKKTYLTIKAREMLMGREHPLLSPNRKRGWDRADLHSIREFFEELGVIKAARQEAEGCIVAADRELRVFADPRSREELEAFSALVLNRKR